MIATLPMIDRQSIAQTGIIPEGLQFLRDTMPLKIVDSKKTITESANGKIPVMKYTGIFQRADKKNANGRIYPEDVLRDAIDKLQESVKNRMIPGEFDHPPDAKIHLDRISHLITRLWMENKTVYGEIEVINDSRCPCGSMLSCLLERGMQVGISSRGVGDMEMVMHEGEECYQVQEGFEFVTFDAVAEPSVAGTQLKKKLNESRIRQSRQAQVERYVSEELLVREFDKFLRS